jgi:ribosomal protein S28E/S33
VGDIQAVYDGQEFDASQVEPQKAYEPLPAGWYPVMIAEADVMPTKAGTGHLLKVKLEVLEGTGKGRTAYWSINLRNPNPQAEEIGMRELSSLAHAIGEMRIRDTAQIRGKILQVKLKVETSEQYGPQNKVTGAKSITEAAAVAPAAAAPAAITQAQPAAVAPAAAAKPAGFVPPWKR